MKYIAIIALVCQGCYSEGAYYVDARFNAEERAAIQQAADTWTTPVDLVFGADVNAFEAGSRRIIVKVNAQIMEIADPGASGRRVPGYTDGIRYNHILLNPDNVGVAPLWYVAAHEMGHSMGLDHVADHSALMYETNTDETRWCLTQADADEFARVNGMRIRTGCKE